MLDARRRACLEAMGIEVWRERAEGHGPGAGEGVPSAGFASMMPDPQLAEGAFSGSESPGLAASNLDSRTSPQPAVAPDALQAERSAGITASPSAAPSGPASVSALDLDGLRQAVSKCRACDLHQTRTQTVFGVGDPSASLMIIGEAPGADEDRQGEPFVGRAGQLLNAMLAAIGLQREAVYIANIIKCRPPGNRDPHAEEAAACQPFLHRQIELIQPKLILSVGRISAHNLLGTEEAVGRLRGRTHRFDPGGIPLIVTYHPAYLLRRPQEKAKAWQDLQAAYRVLNGRVD